MQTREEIQQPEGPAPEGREFPAFNTEGFPPQVIWLAITFVVLYVILARLALPRIARVMSERQDRIADDLDEAERMQSESREIEREYEATLAEARAEAQALLAKARDEARARHEARSREFEARLDEKIATAQAEIDAARQRAMDEIDTAARDAAGQAIERLIGRELDAQALDKAVAAAKAARGKAA